MDISKIQIAMEPVAAGRGCFLTEVSVSRDNDVTVAIESEEGTVTMEDCIALDKAFHELFDQDVEDYSLTVTSAGLDQPFKVLKQFLKAIGSEVEVRLKGGRKLAGVLTGASAESISLRYSALEEVEGKKKKVRVEREETFPLGEINSVMPHFSFD